MASEEEQKERGSGMGFAGLSSLVSEVDSVIRSTRQNVPELSIGGTTGSDAEATSRPTRTKEPEPRRQPYQPPPQPSGESSTGKWLLGIGAVAGVIWLLSSGSETKKVAPTPTTYSAAPSAPSATRATAPNEPRQAPTQAPSRAIEDKPPIGTNHVLSPAQVRYCLSEDVRLKAAREVVDNYVESDVDRFNAMVTDYNSRCGSFRYRSGVLESARPEVERNRRALEAEGRRRFSRNLSAGTHLEKALVQAIQKRLNEIGYDAGVADGLAGPMTRAAIMAFQRDQNLSDDGVASLALLDRLNRARPREKVGSGRTGKHSSSEPAQSQPTRSPQSTQRGQ